MESELDPVIFMIINKAVINYSDFLKKYFDKDITNEDNLIIMPIGFKLPLNPIEYVRKQYNTKVQNDYVNQIMQAIIELNDEGVEESVLMGFDLSLNKVGNVKNADFVAELSKDPNAVPIRKDYQITNDTNAPKIRIEPPLPPLRYNDVKKRAKEKKPDIKFGKTFYKVIKEIKNNPLLCQERYLDPIQKTGTKKWFYEEEAVDVLIKRYDEIEADEETV